MKNCALDLGNTQLKVALFQDRDFLNLEVFTTFQDLVSFLNNETIEHSILSSVLNGHETQQLLSQLNIQPKILGESTPIPIQNNYRTPKTLGNDRLANACFAGVQCPGQSALVIDAGTCLKMDLVNAENEYLGGSIGPGLEMRFKALNNYTGNLPLLSNEEEYQNLVGNDTNTSILSGVKIGMQEEINGLIRRYEANYDDLTIFITGGDLDKFELKSKNTIFADRLITLKGLNEILLFNI
ncbi:MAG: type III pantothenate kinase [Crocinitomicaceae bacterium]|nr:type III pantothenate kinase [Crocinitomicaceae bacterium]